MSGEDSVQPSAPAAAGDALLPGGAPPASNRWKWWIAGVLFLATVLTYLDRQTLSLCASMISEDLGLNNEQYGQLQAAFRWTYALTHIPAGFLADHVPLRPTYALAVLLWSAAGAAAALVGNVRQFLFTRGLLGVGEAFNWPCATRIVANMLPPEDRGLASGIFNSGAAVGSLIAPFVILPLALRYGWRTAFIGMGTLGLFWVVLWVLVTGRRSAAHGAINRPQAAPRPARDWRLRARAGGTWIRQVLLHPAFWMLLLIGVCTNPCWYFLNEWIPKYMHDQRGMSHLTAGMVSFPVFLAADFGNLASGGLVKWLTASGWSLRRARGTTVAVAAGLIMPVALLTHVGNLYLAIALLALAAYGITSIVASYTACQQDFSFANVGAVAGILGMACNVFSATFNPLIGRYVDVTGQYTLIFTLMAVLPLASLAALLTFDWLVWKPR